MQFFGLNFRNDRIVISFTVLTLFALFAACREEVRGPGTVIGKKQDELVSELPPPIESEIEDILREDDAVSSVTVENQTGFTILWLEISPTTASQWRGIEADVLGEDRLLNDETSVNVPVTGYGSACSFDLRAIDEDQDSYTILDVNLCRNDTVTFTLEDLDVDT